MRWLWQDRIPAGAVTMIPGRAGIGKSQFACWLTAQVTRGLLPGVLNGQPRPVFYAASEDSWEHTLAPRMVAAGVDMAMMYRVEVDAGGVLTGLSLPRDCDALAAEIDARGVGMLLLDPLMSAINSKIDTHRERDVRVALEPLSRMADQTGCAVVGLAHFNKSSGTDPLTMITGSGAFGNVIRSGLAMARDDQAEDGSGVISQCKANLGKDDTPSLRYRIETATVDTEDGPSEVGRLVMLGETDRSVRDILTETYTDPADRNERDEAADWLRGYLIEHGGDARAADVVKAARADGIAESTLKRARTRAGVTTQRKGYGQGSIWSHDPTPDPSSSSQSGPGHTPDLT